ncbi:hypothetical protein NDU88_006283 [Pleurodeles waltl]|uniref:Uncharacterized protein n=1 Tax=Pleurodeles waltl TaxID=8319 RepID=A0AAV7LP45_PLEWA|nr:hypothetical protein NDU88_006283 [Pleurodeles waltl]
MTWPQGERDQERGTPRRAQTSPIRSRAEPLNSPNARRGLQEQSTSNPEGASDQGGLDLSQATGREMGCA